MSRCRSCTPVPEEVRRGANLLERRWLISILYAALEGAARWGEFRQALEDIPPATLSERLRRLERAGILERRVAASTPPVVEYRLTREGRELAPVVEAMTRWTQRRSALS